MASTFPTNYITWSGYHGAKTCYPAKGDVRYTAPAFTTRVAKKDQWIQSLGVGSSQMTIFPTQAMKSHYGIETCAFHIVSVYSVTYVRVIYITMTSTITRYETDMAWEPIFPSIISSDNKTLFPKTGPKSDWTSWTARPLFATANSLNLSLITSAIEVVDGNANPFTFQTAIPTFDGEDFVKANQLDINPNISSYCSSYYASVYSSEASALKTSQPSAAIVFGGLTKFQSADNHWLNAWPMTSYPALVTPCCGQCTLSISAVGVQYWPVLAAQKTPIAVNNTNFSL